MMRWYVAGLGRAGGALAKALADEQQLVGAWTRSAATADVARPLLNVAVDVGPLPMAMPDCDAILLAVPDRAVGPIAATLVATVEQSGLHAGGPCLVHCSGAATIAALPESLRDRRGGAHPLMSLHGPRDRDRLRGAFIAVEGTGRGGAAARDLARAVGGIAGEVSAEQKVAYHAAAVLASNGVYALAAAVDRLLEGAGLGASAALRSGMRALTIESASAVACDTVHAAATGPVVRGDAGTLRAHLTALAEQPAEVQHLYRAVQALLLAVADERGLDPALLGALHAVLYGASEAGP